MPYVGMFSVLSCHTFQTVHEKYFCTLALYRRTDFQENQTQSVISLGYNQPELTRTAITTPMMPGPKYGYFYAYVCCTSNNSNSVFPVAVHLRSERAPWRALPIGTMTVYELFHRYGSQHPWQ